MTWQAPGAGQRHFNSQTKGGGKLEEDWHFRFSVLYVCACFTAWTQPAICGLSCIHTLSFSLSHSLTYTHRHVFPTAISTHTLCLEALLSSAPCINCWWQSHDNPWLTQSSECYRLQSEGTHTLTQNYQTQSEKQTGLCVYVGGEI